jgi:uncharacterized protein YjiS (DUF1127 family)
MNRVSSAVFMLSIIQYLDASTVKIVYRHKQISDRLKRYWHRYRSRQQLARLPPERLNDIGLTVAQAQEEMNKPFWR